MKKTVIIGASPNPMRYSYLAAHRLLDHGHEVILLGTREGDIREHRIHLDRPAISDVDTVTLYINPLRQPDWYDYILELNPSRIIFNPGTENPELAELAEKKHIRTENACTLVMLSTGQF